MKRTALILLVLGMFLLLGAGESIPAALAGIVLLALAARLGRIGGLT